MFIGKYIEFKSLLFQITYQLIQKMNIQQFLKNIRSKKNDIPLYKPIKKEKPNYIIEVTSAWKGHESIIKDIIDRFNISRKSCIEFGVEFGYSTVVFSNYFERVIGIDTFQGDVNTVNKERHFEDTKQRLSRFSNIELIKSDYRDWIIQDKNRYDFAHVDIVHTYAETFECGLWAAQHSDCATFHDTESFLEVRNAVKDIAKITGQELYNYPFYHGLGILVDRNINYKR